MSGNQVYDHYPILSVLYTDLESNAVIAQWSDLNWDAAAVSVVCYLLFIVLGTFVMKGRKAFELKIPLQLWNLTLCLFSFMGACRTVPHLLLTIKVHGLYYSICHDPVDAYGAEASGVWTILFILSKIPELGDTVFLILRKREVIFLHWYHHITVLLFCWHSLMTKSSAGLYFIAMNFSVHAVMYCYYFLQACRIRVPWARFVTIFQISQMVVGIVIQVLISYYWSTNSVCHVSPSNYYAAIIMYSSYFALFAVFYLNRFVRPSKTGGKQE